MLKLSEVREENAKLRYDPEFFGKEARAACNALRHHRRFGELVADGYRVVYESTEIIEREVGVRENLPFFLQAADIETPFVRPEGMGCVSKADWDRYTKGRVVPGELLIEVKGQAEKVALVPDDFPRNTLITGTCYKMRTKDSLDAPLLIAFLTSRHGQALKNRLKSNLLVAFVSKEDLFAMPVPNFGTPLKKAIAATVGRAFAADRTATTALAAAEETLTAALGLRGWQPPEPLTYTRRASEALAAGRIDAEFFHPAKRAYLDRLGAMPGRPLSEHYVSIREMFDPGEAATGALVRNFDLTDALRPVLDDSRQPMPAREVGSTKKRFQPGDVVTSRLRAYLRETALVRTTPDIPAVGSSEFIVLRPHDPKPRLSRAALLVFLRSQPVQTILQWSQEGNQHPRYNEDNLLSIPVPDAICAISADLEALFSSLLTARQRSRDLLAAAQRAVEIAIEQSEAEALKFLSATTP